MSLVNVDLTLDTGHLTSLGVDVNTNGRKGPVVTVSHDVRKLKHYLKQNKGFKIKEHHKGTMGARAKIRADVDDDRVLSNE